jgi:hypothetical protein
VTGGVTSTRAEPPLAGRSAVHATAALGGIDIFVSRQGRPRAPPVMATRSR